MHPFFKEQKESISKYLTEYLKQRASDLISIHAFGREVCQTILDFTVKGKMIRGGLVFLACQLFDSSGLQTLNLAKAGAVLELLQSALLIHDDIMDRDKTRRGFDSVYYKYVKGAELKKISGSYHLGEALGICAGDVTFFLAFEILSHLNLPLEKHKQVQYLCAAEMSNVGIAQMIDVHWGSATDRIDEKSILKLYKYKTGRYTFSLPLMIGGIIGTADDKAIKILEEIGELLGIVFQIKDDELGLFGDEKQIGKPCGSDIREGKKTIFIHHLLNTAEPADTAKVLKILGNPQASADEIEYIKFLLNNLGIKTRMAKMVSDFTAKVYTRISDLAVNHQHAEKVFRELIHKNTTRTF